MQARSSSRFVASVLALGLATGACAERSLLADQASPTNIGVSQYNPSTSGSEPWGDQLPDVPSVAGTRMTFLRIRIALRAYGTWGEHPEYGPVWYPSENAAGSGFTPYLTAGHWVPTDAGMYWASDLPFGWVTFHYGRWVSYEGRWAWVPGARFAPAWVDWRTSGQYAGWAPLPPEGAPLTAPYAYCQHTSVTVVNVWNVAIVGAPAAALYGTTRAMPARRGYGGATYAWGPTDRVVATPVASSGPSGPVRVEPARANASGPVVVTPAVPSGGASGMTVASAWSRETAPAARTGVPVHGAPSGGAGGDLSYRAPDAIREAARSQIRASADTEGPGRDGDDDVAGAGSRRFEEPMPTRARAFRDYEPVFARPRITETVRISDPSDPVYAPQAPVRLPDHVIERSAPAVSAYEPPRVAPVAPIAPVAPFSPPPAPPSQSWGSSPTPWNVVHAPAPAWHAPAPVAAQSPHTFGGGSSYAAPTVSRYVPVQQFQAPQAVTPPPAAVRAGPVGIPAAPAYAAPAFSPPRFNAPSLPVVQAGGFRRFQ